MTRPDSASPAFYQDSFELGAEFLDNNELDTRGKLRALARDPRAGFLPATNLEKGVALALLDYPGNTPKAVKTANQLQEIFLHQKRDHDLKVARRTLYSVAYEFGDFLTNANDQLPALEDFKRRIKDCPNPNVSLAEELGYEHPGMAPFVRYFDIRQLRDRRSLPLFGFKPMETVFSRHPELEDDPDARHKTIEDQYTAKSRDPRVTGRIHFVADTLTVGSVRSLSREAAQDQHNRRNFWERRLREARNHGAAKPIAEQVLKSLGLAVR